MFTGLVQHLGQVRASTADSAGGLLLTVEQPGLAPALVLGESIAVDGCCLTVTRQDDQSFDFQVGPETVAKTTLARKSAGSLVNLERALRLSDTLGGHIVTGHIDGVGRLESITTQGEWRTVWFVCDPAFDDLLVHKGSIAVDGVSLTLVDVEKGRFSVMLIPHTLAHTTLGSHGVGTAVNLEADLLAKHVQKLFKNLTIVI
jgi:riboflavin synthase